MGATKKRLKKLGSGALKKIYRENDRTKYTSQSIKIAKEILEERGEEIPEQEVAKGEESESEKDEDGGNKKSEDEKDEEEVVGIRDKLDQLIDKIDQKENKSRWKHKIISGPILSSQEELEEELNDLGESGWELVDTQRHSIAAKQHAVCFLKKKK